jgi:adenylosuccinate synthase
MLDVARENASGKAAIGTTKRGIGPAYEDKVARRSLRVNDLFDAKRCADKLRAVVDYHNFILRNYYHTDVIDFESVLAEILAQGEQLKPLVADIPILLWEHYQKGEKLLFEGAQGSLLDIDQGTYPFVTSSNTTVGSAATGSGFGPLYLDYVLGVMKAYTTRVGSGPFPTELFNDQGKYLAEHGHEFGSTTGRPRRCGWFDAVIARRVVQMNSVSGLCVTKLDVLDGLETIRICVGYSHDTEQCSVASYDAEALLLCKPIYEDVPGWQESTLGITDYNKLPNKAKYYLKRIEESVGVPIAMISTGPDRCQAIMLNHPFG